MGTRNALRVLLIVLLAALAALYGCTQANLPRAEFTATPRFDYPPLDVSFDAGASSSPNGAVVSYAWDFGDGDTGAGVTAEHTYTEKGIYTVTLTVTDSSGKIGARSITVEALNRSPVASFTTWPYVIGVNYPAEFDASASYDPDGEIVDYLWSFGDGTSASGMIVEHEYTTAGGSGWQPAVTLTVVDEDGGTSSVTHHVNVVGCDSCG